MPRNLARRDVLLPVVRRYIYIALGVIRAAFFRFPSLFLFVDPLLGPVVPKAKRRRQFPRRPPVCVWFFALFRLVCVFAFSPHEAISDLKRNFVFLFRLRLRG